MKKMQIGQSSVYAPELVLGTFGMGGGTSWQDTTDDDKELEQLIVDAYDLGITGIDTAPVYGTGRSERIVGRAIKGRRDDYFLSTKCSLNWRGEEGSFEYSRDGFSVYRCFSPEALTQDVKDSLERMEIDVIDTMIIHRCPKKEEIPQVMETMEKLRAQGLIRSVGISNAGFGGFSHAEVSPDPVGVIETCLKYGELDLVQEPASLLDRDNLGEYLAACDANQITFQNYSGLSSGALAGKISRDMVNWKGDNRSGKKWYQPENIDRVITLNKQLEALAERKGCTVPVLALAYLRAQSPHLSLLVGARHLASIKDTLKVLDVTLTRDEVAEMNALSDAAQI